MNRRSTLVVLIIAGAASCIAATAFGQHTLPREMEGRFTVQAQWGETITNTWAVQLNPPQADGSLKGKITYNGKFCQMQNEPATGSFDGEVKMQGARVTPFVYLIPR